MIYVVNRVKGINTPFFLLQYKCSKHIKLTSNCVFQYSYLIDYLYFVFVLILEVS